MFLVLICLAQQISLYFLSSLTLIWLGWEGIIHLPPSPPPCWFCLNNSETVNAVTGIWQRLVAFFRDICAKFGNPNLR